MGAQGPSSDTPLPNVGGGNSPTAEDRAWIHHHQAELLRDYHSLAMDSSRGERINVHAEVGQGSGASQNAPWTMPTWAALLVGSGVAWLVPAASGILRALMSPPQPEAIDMDDNEPDMEEAPASNGLSDAALWLADVLRLMAILQPVVVGLRTLWKGRRMQGNF